MRCNVAVVCAALLVASCRAGRGEAPGGGADAPAPEVVPVVATAVPFGVEDRGIFGDLDPDVFMGIPECVEPSGVHLVVSRASRTLSLYYLGVAVKTYPVLGDPPPDGEHAVVEVAGGAVLVGTGEAERIGLRKEDALEIRSAVMAGTRVIVGGVEPDADQDGIPDQVDVHAGAIKCALDGASYDSAFYKISYPMGDVPRDRGSCADVVVRALRNAGLDLQELVQEDMAARPKAYGGAAPNPSIDHRRVRNLLVFMNKHFLLVEDGPHLPGDIVFLDTLPKKGPDHIGIVTWSTSGDGLPLVVNSWTWGYQTSAMGLLSWLDVTHRFRVR